MFKTNQDCSINTFELEKQRRNSIVKWLWYMSIHSIRVYCLAGVVVLFAVGGMRVCAEEKPTVASVSAKDVGSFLEAYCVDCHGVKKQKGDVRLDQMSYDIGTNGEAQRWQDILDILNAGDMPPEDEPQPKNADLEAVLGSLTRTLRDARKRLTERGGEVIMRRLNRREYANTIRDLFGFEIPLSMIPEDDEASTFDTVGTDQFFTSSHFEKYLELGREIAASGLAWCGKPRQEVTIDRKDPEERLNNNLRVKLADLDHKMRMKNEGKTWQEMGFDDEGQMNIIFSQFKNRAGKPRKYLQYPMIESGIYMAVVNNETRRIGTNRSSKSVDPRGRYRLRVRGGVVGNPPNIRKFARVTANDRTLGVLKMEGTPDDPGVMEIDFKPGIEPRALNFFVEENRADIRVLEAYLGKLGSEEEWASLWIDWLEIEGPFYDGPTSFFGELIGSAGAEGSPDRAGGQAREVIERFCYEAYRRQAPSEAFVDRLVDLYEQNRAEGQSHEVAMSEVLGIVLTSPQFLFLQEGRDDSSKSERLDDRAFAVRLSYFLWSSPPDAELYGYVEDGTLMRPRVLRKQVDRMLDDPKAASFYEGFMGQWAELDRFNAITVDENEHFRFNEGVRHSAYREVLAFFKTLVDENLPASNLIDSDFAVINPVLGEHYGIAGATSNAFKKVRLPADSPRGGLMGQAAFLTTGSNGERTSPVIRGTLVMEKLLHDPPPPPPPNVPELGAASNGPATNRQMVELHQGRAVCASCHRKIDAIGFGLENFDVTGRWRETERVGNKDVPIEPGGALPDGAAFDDLEGLKATLVKHGDKVAWSLVESMVGYGLGRTVEFSDSQELEVMMKELESEDYRVRSMIHKIVASSLFATK